MLKQFDLPSYQNDITEILLADIALKIQLTPTEYKETVAHYQAIEKWLERDDSSLKGLVVRIYPQGSMAIHATISSNQDVEEFDIDLVVELNIPSDSDPETVLDDLYEAVRGRPGSLYYDVTERNSRCVTAHFKNMHLDLCPAVLMPEQIPDRPERTSTMFHHNKERDERYWHIRNPWGFADWYNDSAPKEEEFSLFYEERGLVGIRAQAEPIPEPTPVYQKPRKVVALQLIKRFRNHRYMKRALKAPPSIILSKLSIDAGWANGGLLDELELQAAHLEVRFRDYAITVHNPRCPKDDIFTDRWPSTAVEQREFYRDIRHLQTQLTKLRYAADLPSKQKILADLFGERATTSAFESLQRKYDDLSGRGAVKVDMKTAGIAVAASGISGKPVQSSSVVTAPRHYSHAGKRRWKD